MGSCFDADKLPVPAHEAHWGIIRLKRKENQTKTQILLKRTRFNECQSAQRGLHSNVMNRSYLEASLSLTLAARLHRDWHIFALCPAGIYLQ